MPAVLIHIYIYIYGQMFSILILTSYFRGHVSSYDFFKIQIKLLHGWETVMSMHMMSFGTNVQEGQWAWCIMLELQIEITLSY